MGFNRAMVRKGGQVAEARAGEGNLAHLRVTTNATAGNQSITVAAIMGGVALFTGAAGAVNYTFPTASDLLAALPDMDIGDTYSFYVTNTAAQAATLTTNTGLTLAGFTTANAQTRLCILQKTAAATATITII